MQMSPNEASIMKSDANSMQYETTLYLYDHIVLGNMDPSSKSSRQEQEQVSWGV